MTVFRVFESMMEILHTEQPELKYVAPPGELAAVTNVPCLIFQSDITARSHA